VNRIQQIVRVRLQPAAFPSLGLTRGSELELADEIANWQIVVQI